jgi:hypothetical protein
MSRKYSQKRADKLSSSCHCKNSELANSKLSDMHNIQCGVLQAVEADGIDHQDNRASRGKVCGQAMALAAVTREVDELQVLALKKEEDDEDEDREEKYGIELRRRLT